MSDNDTSAQVATLLEKLQIANENLQTQEGFQKASENLYAALEGISAILLAWRQYKGEPGWARHITNKNNQPLFTEDQANLLESALRPLHAQLESLFEEPKQRGGDGTLGAVQMPLEENAIVQKPFHFAAEDISLDKVYYGIMDTLDAYDNQAKEIARRSGVLRFESCLDEEGKATGPCPDFMVGAIPIPRRLLLPVLSGLIDTLRLALGNPLLDVPILRILLSMGLAVLDVMRGDWKNGVISFMGVVSARATVLSFFLRLLRNVWLLMSPDLQVRLRDDMYRSSKSIFVGFFLWIFTVVAPMPVRESLNIVFSQLQQFGQSLSDQIKQVETSVQPPPESRIKLVFPNLPLKTIPSMDDIQNLQTILHEPLIVCSKEVQNIIKGMLQNVPLRLILELMNIPTTTQDIQVMCPEGAEKSISENITDLAKQIQVVMPTDTATEVKAAEDPSAVKPEEPSAVKPEEPTTTATKEPAATVTAAKPKKGGRRTTPRRAKSRKHKGTRRHKRR